MIEFGGFEFDIRRSFPDQTVRRECIGEYLRALTESICSGNDSSKPFSEIVEGFEVSLLIALIDQQGVTLQSLFRLLPGDRSHFHTCLTFILG